MARLLAQVVEEPRPCSYLDDRAAKLEHLVLVDSTAEELESLLVRGWRRFGPDHFRPRCAPCHECVPTRVPTATFAPTKSQRRARKACAGLRPVVGRPRVDAARLDLYQRWHDEREAKRGWTATRVDERSYRMQFAFPHPAAREIAYWHDAPDGSTHLVGVGICDQTPRCWSAVYFFYDPDWASRSLGVANVVFQVELARGLDIPHVYLGYRVGGCPSLAYKARFAPQERLDGWPEDGEEPRWIPAASPEASLGG
jgi:leucyl-tRNA---protein transferase